MQSFGEVIQFHIEGFLMKAKNIHYTSMVSACNILTFFLVIMGNINREELASLFSAPGF